ncbi:hypothetical protein GCM10010965_14230 [Caldalkalibacillus thermarum]|nr:hypothetical protein [Caldalkalibacillus thermarum]GGK22461.1 hypothetical protein GCM10010965_14230 [Caldalkalibacillus thermarum]
MDQKTPSFPEEVLTPEEERRLKSALKEVEEGMTLKGKEVEALFD